MSSYYEHLSIRGNAASFNYSQAGKGGSVGTAGIIRATSSDFICDVETSARRGLTESEHNFFDVVFLKQDELYVDLWKSQYGTDRFYIEKKDIQIKLGKVFESRGVFPVHLYFKPVDVRR